MTSESETFYFLFFPKFFYSQNKADEHVTVAHAHDEHEHVMKVFLLFFTLTLILLVLLFVVWFVFESHKYLHWKFIWLFDWIKV